ncbi:hybrid sensor histidine kinase/response regulator [Caballeronia sp. M23-90]
MNASNFVVHKFGSAVQERAFIVDYARRFVAQRRLAGTASAFIWAGFMLRDWWIVHALASPIIWKVGAFRVVGGIGMYSAVWLAWRPRFYDERAATRIIVAGTAAAWLGILGIMLVVPLDIAFREYYPGLLLIFLMVFTLFRLRAVVAAWAGCACLLIFNLTELVGYVRTQVPMQQQQFALAWVSASIYSLIYYLVGFGISAQLELAARRDFVARRSQLAAKGRADAANQAISRQNAAMKELANDKERFFSSAYHDIQQPLAAINLFVWSARNKLKQGRDASHDLEVVANTARDILDMFKGIQEYSQLGTYDPQIAPVDLTQVIDELADQYGGVAASKAIVFRIADRRGRAERPWVLSDRPMLKRVLSNLVSNAIRNTHEGGVVIGWVNLRDRIRVDVRDTGVGIAAQHRNAIFSEYFQLCNPGRDPSKGLGLGLSIVRRVLAILPDHVLQLRSIEGRGSRFSVYVPASIRATVPRSAESHAPEDLSTLEGKYAILCDDDPAVLEGLRRLFSGAGLLVDAVGSIAEVATLLQGSSRSPDVVITDLRLGDSATGADVARQVRQHFSWAGVIPVAFVTGELLSPNILRDFQRPFILLQKSASPQSILLEVGRLVATQGTSDDDSNMAGEPGKPVPLADGRSVPAQLPL